ncbi:MAG: hypothetical protein RSB36_05790 [Hydrogenoanaerobacterium sp.]
MLSRLWVRLRNITNKLHQKSGNGALVWGMAGLCIISLFTMLLMEKKQLHMVTNEVSRDITTTLAGAAGSHIYDSYAPVRDGTSGAYVFNGTSFNEIRDTSKFYELFTQLYADTKVIDGNIVKIKDGKMIFKISDLRLFVSNAVSTNEKTKYRVNYTLIFAEDLLWKGNFLTLQSQQQTVEYMNRF